jgi:Tfp pilus assembly protein PilO
MNRNRTIALGVLAFLLVVNLLIFFTYRVRQRARIDDLVARREATEARLVDARNLRSSKERHLQALKDEQDKVKHIYDDRWSTPQRRLVPLLLELRALAEKSSLIPQSIAYTLQDAEKNQGTTAVKIMFGVEGSYANVRKLVNLIELSPQFVYIDAISISNNEAGALRLNLSLKTLFTATEEPAGKRS